LSPQSAVLTCSHNDRKRRYAEFKASLLEELDPLVGAARIVEIHGRDRAYEVVEMRTRADRSLHVLRHEFYDGRKIVPAWIAEQLNARMLAFWFMDDGYTRLRPPRQPGAEIATNGFSDRDRRILLEGLLRLGLRAEALRGRVHFDVEATRRLSAMIAPFVPPSMRYKLHPEVRDAVAFDPGGLVPGPRRVLYDDVEVEDITSLERADRTFFCIDVDETHNFVTTGGVVHNCRPPGNRDPLPAEIDNCQDYLMRQVELIEPRVICTLGNFSTKLLRADPTGISRLHGQAEIRVIGSRAVRLYPLFHPAAALYTRSLLETLRADFARLPELLALPLPEQPERSEPAVPEPELAAPEPDREPEPEPEQPAADPAAEQLGLF
jgi:uracil-DNA glycosylase family 4